MNYIKESKDLDKENTVLFSFNEFTVFFILKILRNTNASGNKVTVSILKSYHFVTLKNPTTKPFIYIK